MLPIEQFQFILEKGYLLTVFSNSDLFEKYKATLKCPSNQSHNFTGDSISQIIERMYNFVVADIRSGLFRQYPDEMKQKEFGE